MINLKEAGQDYELRDCSIYTKLQRKLPETMLTQYHRWIFENHKDESVMTLRTWVLREAEFRTIASETVHGLLAEWLIMLQHDLYLDIEINGHSLEK